jgi:FMN phosphatase YigB (HAD superfamily)
MAMSGTVGARANPAAVLFDFGGTLDADGVTWKDRIRRLFEREGLAAAPAVFDAVFHAVDDGLTGHIPEALPFRGTVGRLVAGVAAGLGVRDPAIPDRVATRFVDDSLAALHGRLPLLRRLAPRYRLGVVSNFYGNLATVCADAGVAPVFSVLVDSARVGYRKPDPRIFHRALGTLGVAPSRAVFVGDSLARDMGGARGVGMPHIWLRPEASPRAEPCCPGDRVVHVLGALEGLLL